MNSQLTSAESGAIELYRQYAEHYETQQVEQKEFKEERKDKKRNKRNGFDNHDEPLNLRLKQLRPIFDCEISRRPQLMLTKPSEKPTVVLTMSIPCLNSFQTNKSTKNQVQYDCMDLSFPTLISWLMTLVEDSNQAPFVVVGLQMMTKNNIPYMYVLINPTSDDNDETKKIKKRKNYSEFNEFVAKVKRFMSSTKLNEVTSWAWKPGSPVDQLLSEMEYDRCEKNLSTFFQINTDPNAVENLKREEYGFEWAQIIPQNVPHQARNATRVGMIYLYDMKILKTLITYQFRKKSCIYEKTTFITTPSLALTDK